MSGRLAGKVAIVTGAGNGIGAAIALKLASEGASVVINDLEPDAAAETLSAVEQLGHPAVARAGDVTADETADLLVAAADTLGGVDIVVNNAGYASPAAIHKMTDTQWTSMLDVHLSAPFRLLRAAAPGLRARAKRDREHGRRVNRKVVNVSSVTGLHGAAGMVNYAAAKAGVVGLTKALAREWGRYDVNVNAVAFGIIRTRATVSIDVERHYSAERDIPLRRFGTVEEAAGAAYLLCIPESDYVTGETLVCSGGFTP